MSGTNVAPITTNINIGVNEVVAVFVAKYETGLFAKKDRLSADLRAARSVLEQIDKDLIASVDPEQYAVKVPSLRLSFSLGEVKVMWEGSYQIPKNTLLICTNMYDHNADTKGPCYIRYEACPIEAETIKTRQDALQIIADINVELAAVLIEIKSVGRKERQVRGRIAEMQLAESGMSELLNRPDMLQLIEVK